MIAYFYLFAAIILEVIATTALKFSEQFTKPIPVVVMVVFYLTSFYFFTLVLKYLPLGVAEALWSGLGLILIVIIGAVQFKEIPDLAAILGILLIIVGIAVIHFFSKTIH